MSDFASLTDMAQKIRRDIEQSNCKARPFAWSKASFRKVLPEWAGEVAEPPCQIVASLEAAA